MRAAPLVAFLISAVTASAALHAQPPPEPPPPVEPPPAPAEGTEAPAPGEPPVDPPPVEQPPAEPPPEQPPAEPPPVAPAPAPAPPPPGYGAPYGQPGYPPPAYPPQQPGYGYGPPPPTPKEKPPEPCCLWSLRYDPFDLILRRVTLEGEIAWGDLPFSVELAPSYIFDSTIDEIDEQGFDIAARIAWYIQGNALKGFWLKAHFNFEYFQATLYNEIAEEQYAGTPHPEHCDADSEPGTCTTNVNTAVLGLMLGSSMVFPSTGGFALTGGIGLGGALADEKRLEVQGTPTVPGRFYVYYDEFGKRLKLLGTLSLGITF